MKLQRLLTLGFATALLSVVTAVGCSEPDVVNFSGNDAQPAADEDDDDDNVRQAQTHKGGNDDGDDDVSDDADGKPTKKKDDDKGAKGGDTTTTPPPAETTPAECFTKCVGPVPEAVALDECTKTCADNDTDCLGDCYDSSNCGANPLCNAAIEQCGQKCPQE